MNLHDGELELSLALDLTPLNDEEKSTITQIAKDGNMVGQLFCGIQLNSNMSFKDMIYYLHDHCGLTLEEWPDRPYLKYMKNN